VGIKDWISDARPPSLQDSALELEEPKVSTFELFHSYRHGWQDASASRMPDIKFTEHATRPDLTAEYQRGYQEGRENYTKNMATAMLRIGYSPNVLRGSEGNA